MVLYLIIRIKLNVLEANGIIPHQKPACPTVCYLSNRQPKNGLFDFVIKYDTLEPHAPFSARTRHSVRGFQHYRMVPGFGYPIPVVLGPQVPHN